MKTFDIFKNPSERSFFFAVRKTEKIVTALYLVTDVMDPELPLTRSVRTESLGLLDACYRVLSSGAMSPDEVARIIVRMEHVSSLVSIGRITQHISEMNAEVLLSEMGKVVQAVTVELAEIRSRHASYSAARGGGAAMQPAIPSQVLSDAAFDEMAKTRKRQNDIKTTLTTPINDIGAMSNSRRFANDTGVSKTTSSESLVSKGSSQKKSSGNAVPAGDRKQKILDVVTSHKNATMQDIQKFVTECSDKTLQREVLSLIGLGLIRKEGDKRWATYHLV